MKKLPALLALTSTLILTSPLSQAGVIYTFTALLSGSAESPSNASPGSGTASVIFDITNHTLEVITSFSGLSSTTTASHIHCCGLPTAAVATQTPTFTGFPLGVTAGSYDHTFDTTLASTYRAGFITANGGSVAGAEAALLAGLQAGNAYLNIHTTAFPGGEIRGILEAPEPATLSLFSLALVGLGLSYRKKAG